MATDATEPLACLRGIVKRFGAVTVLRGVDFDVHAGEVHVLAGENGAGKSTLIRILGGVYPDFEGTIRLGSRLVRPRSPHEAAEAGVSVIHQELSLVPGMSVADNLFLGCPHTRAGFVNDRAQARAAARLLARLGLDLPPGRRVGELPVALQQAVEIAKALARDARVIVMDEPTSALSAPEVERLFAIIAELKAAGRGIVYITHRMEEIARIADRITVLRDGARVASAPARDLPPAELVRAMVGREIREQYPAPRREPGPERLRLERFGVPARAGRGPAAVRGVSLAVRAGEVMGLAGLQGSGCSELLQGLFGAAGGKAEGTATLDGEGLDASSPRRSLAQGVALLTSDRKATGLVLPLSVSANATLADLPRLSPWGWRRPARETEATLALGGRLRLRAASPDQEAGALSGGNQQKVALAKWVQVRPRVLLLDEPTRGIDVGAKRDVYDLIGELAAEGAAVLLTTSELPELLALSDRIVVLHRGAVAARFARGEAGAEQVMAAAMGAGAPGGL